MPVQLIFTALSIVHGIIQTVAPVVSEYFSSKNREPPTTTKSPYCALPLCEQDASQCPEDQLEPSCLAYRTTIRRSNDEPKLVTLATTTAAAKEISSSGGLLVLFLFIVILAVVAFFCFRGKYQNNRNSYGERGSGSITV